MKVNAKSIMGIMMLAASRGTQLMIRAEGTDEEEAVEALSKLVESGFDETD
ncbi:Phosphocarrier protein HPr [Geodia barretti]|nr:Phosphocarrier protein HPr [Geodia barretti]